jgi:CHAT domain-containing protein
LEARSQWKNGSYRFYLEHSISRFAIAFKRLSGNLIKLAKMARKKTRFVGIVHLFKHLRLLAKRGAILLLFFVAFSVAIAPPSSQVAAKSSQELRSRPLNPRQSLHLGKPQDRAGSPILGDLKRSPPRIGGLGGQNLLNCGSPDLIVENLPDAGALVEQGKAFYDAQQFSEAVKVLQKAAIAYQNSGDRLGQAMTLSNLSLAYQQLGEWSLAQSAIAQSLNLLKEGDTNGERSQLLAQSLEVQGRLQLLRGQAEVSLGTWQQAGEIYTRLDDKVKLTRNRINFAQALQTLGYYRQAQKTLTQSRLLLQNLADSEVKTTALRSFGNIFRVVGDYQQSRQMLEQSLAVAKQIESRQAIATALLDLGNTARTQQDTPAALKYYQQAAIRATSSTTRVQAQLNQLSLLVESDRTDESQVLLRQIQTQITSLSPSRATVYARINFAQSLMQLKQKASDAVSWQEIAQILAQAVRQAQKLEDKRAHSYALGYLGELYERAQQLNDAEQLTRQALSLAQTIDAPDTIYLWQWQLGRLLRGEGNLQGAIAAYTDAVNNLRLIRNDLVVLDREVQFSFRDRVEPVYRQLVDLLLQARGTESDRARLQQARSIIESLQLAELENFFRSACLDVQPEAIDRVVDEEDTTAAVVYPIILPDRLEIILKLPGQQLRHYATPKSQDELETILERLQQYIKEPDRTNDVQKLSQQVYDWLIRPIEGDLKSQSIATLVFVLDGSLRNIPMAVLYDRQQQQYLLEKYAIAIAPGLQLLEPKPLPREGLSLLSAGLSEERNVEGKMFSPLENVKLELKQIQAQVSENEELIDRTFTKTNLRDRLNSESFTAVHLATHGQFSSQPEATFILTWDRLLKIDELDSLLRSENVNQRAIELLVLSACETARGDANATLGLAGIAVRSGARSTLATLWSVDDRATSELMSEFYRQMANTNLTKSTQRFSVQEKRPLTKAEALRRAQLSLWKKPNRDWQRPYFWAAYVLIGNWL